MGETTQDGRDPITHIARGGCYSTSRFDKDQRFCLDPRSLRK